MKKNISVNIVEKILQESIPLLYTEEYIQARKIINVSFVQKHLELRHIYKITGEFIQVLRIVVVFILFYFNINES